MNAVYRPLFLTDIEDAADYLMDQNSLQVAQSFRDALKDTLRQICEHPNLGRLRADLPIEGVRTFYIKKFPNWLVFYRSTEDSLEFLRVKHGMMHLPDLFASNE
jgi:plasmid stabilization system protein ParE